MSLAEPLVRWQHVTCGYDREPVLHDLDLSIARGAFVGVVGPSGAGKTTLLRSIVGAVPRIEGRISVGGRDVGSGPSSRVGWVPQLETVDWNFPATVREVVLMGRWSNRSWQAWPTRADREKVDGLLERLGIGGLGNRHIRMLSGGQQQRVFLARAMIGDPELLLLDEPTSGVDIKTRDDVLHLLADLNKDGVTIILTTHELNSVAAHLPWVVCINRGLIAEGDPDEIFTSAILGRTYGADLRVVRQDGALLVADAAPHRLRDALRHRHDDFEHTHHEHADDDHIHETVLASAAHAHDHGPESAASAGAHGHDNGPESAATHGHDH
ncbi:MAG: metal ABC transporter ATP-binding protein [Candidatus Limnocylindrales bacterium]